MRKLFVLSALSALFAFGCAKEKSPAPSTPTTNAPDEATQTNKVDAAEELPEGSRIAHGEKGMVVSVHPLATKAGVEVLKRGGNAIDAAVAVGLTLGVVDSHNSGIGGGCFILIRRSTGAYNAIDGREMAPANAKRDMYI